MCVSKGVAHHGKQQRGCVMGRRASVAKAVGDLAFTGLPVVKLVCAGTYFSLWHRTELLPADEQFALLWGWFRAWFPAVFVAAVGGVVTWVWVPGDCRRRDLPPRVRRRWLLLLVLPVPFADIWYYLTPVRPTIGMPQETAEERMASFLQCCRREADAAAEQAESNTPDA